ncbi:hypothetical protein CHINAEXTREME_10730 [Halobiforma lacisalsi AJ5]|uniref:Uncharacterized protein n=1 Tax=Natronobacterium lacisalsi AJ5 TaxID=358396 RepID=M0L8G7_NATLA|nr:hypothetical protein [Halobiforma lacisalsi]APW98236.1 hypothetical protein CHINAEXTREME_10730 [Halobiforma lacisalsi AJ5]EMA28220.1 hypothetical protein C445_19313 [Halobiforma lacisalsi AJ5]
MSPSKLRTSERRTLLLTIAYMGSLGVVYAIDDSKLWLLWAAVAVAFAGGVLVHSNRSSTEAESEATSARGASGPSTDGDGDGGSGSGAEAESRSRSTSDADRR